MSPDISILLTIFWQFTTISLLAFGGGGAVLPLMEQITVRQQGWLSPTAFISGVGFGYMVPGPVTTTATFIGYQAAGFPGAVAATLGMFLAPVILAASASAGLGKLADNRWVSAFSTGATPAIVGLLAATVWSIARHTISSWAFAGIAVGAAFLAARTKLSPVLLLLGGAAIGCGAWALGW
ncbi:MAG: chromate transporter [Akkermansiaceae bacterium]|nr:chromate transporter [Armatimonadota bacterium]